MFGYKPSYYSRLRSMEKQLITSLDLDFFEPPTQSNAYANTTMSLNDFLSTFYDTHVGIKGDGYTVTKTSLGKDESNTYDIWKYVFEPVNYKRSIVISAGIHAQELPSIFGLALLIGYVMDNPDINKFYRYLRDNVRIICVPIWNPWGFNQTPKIFGNVNGVNINSNFTTQSNWNTLVEDAWNMKGTAPFSESEAIIMRDMLLQYRDEIDFWFDLHVGVNFGNYDHFVQYVDGDYLVQNGLNNALSWLDERFRNLFSSDPIDRYDDFSTSHKLHYAYNNMGISCSTVEYIPQQYGGENNGSTDLFYYLMHLSNYLIGVLAEFEKGLYSNTAYKPKLVNFSFNDSDENDLLISYESDVDCTHELKIDSGAYAEITPTLTHITYSHTYDMSALSYGYHSATLKVTNKYGSFVYKRIVFQKTSPYLAYDTFTKSDSVLSLGTTEIGDFAWINSNGVFGISSNKAKPISLTATTAIATFDCNISDFDISADIVWNTWAGIVFRFVNTTNLMQARISSTGLAVSDASGNTYGTYSFTPVQGNTYNIRVVADGTSVIIYLDEVERINITNSINQTATKVGLKVANEILSTFDNFKVIELPN